MGGRGNENRVERRKDIEEGVGKKARGKNQRLGKGRKMYRKKSVDGRRREAGKGGNDRSRTGRGRKIGIDWEGMDG